MAAKKKTTAVQIQEFNPTFSDMLLEEIASHTESLSRIVGRLQEQHPGFPSIASVYRWLRDNADFAAQYQRAKSDQADLMADQILEISDDDSNDGENSVAVQRHKLMVNSRQWLAGKLKPKAYGERLDIVNKLDISHSVSPIDLTGYINTRRIKPDDTIVEAKQIEN